jgi:hypothetical protein
LQAKQLKETLIQDDANDSLIIKEVYKEIFGPDYFSNEITRSINFLARENNNELVESLGKKIFKLMIAKRKANKISELEKHPSYLEKNIVEELNLLGDISTKILFAVQ